MNEVMDAIIRANKLGAKGVQVVWAEWPKSATEDQRIILVIQEPLVTNATEKLWYED